MYQNNHQNHKNHKQERVGFCTPAVTIPIDKYDELIRVSERAEIVARYVTGSTYNPDKRMVLELLRVEEAEEGGEEF